MSTRVEIDISLPLGDGPDGHIALRVEIPDLAKCNSRDREYVTGVIAKLAEWVPYPADGESAQVPKWLRTRAIGTSA